MLLMGDGFFGSDSAMTRPNAPTDGRDAPKNCQQAVRTTFVGTTLVFI